MRVAGGTQSQSPDAASPVPPLGFVQNSGYTSRIREFLSVTMETQTPAGPQGQAEGWKVVPASLSSIASEPTSQPQHGDTFSRSWGFPCHGGPFSKREGSRGQRPQGKGVGVSVPCQEGPRRAGVGG